jgi:DNA polymerase-3 subunit delta'
LPLPVPTQDEALDWLSQQGVHDAPTWLAAAGGAPLLALRAVQAGGGPVPQWLEGFLDLAQRGGAPAALADALVAQDAAVWIDAAQRLWTDLSLAAHGLPLRYYPAQASAIETLAQSSDPVRLAQTARWLRDQQRLAQHTLNPKFLADHAARMLLGSFGKPARAAS